MERPVLDASARSSEPLRNGYGSADASGTTACGSRASSSSCSTTNPPPTEYEVRASSSEPSAPSATNRTLLTWNGSWPSGLIWSLKTRSMSGSKITSRTPRTASRRDERIAATRPGTAATSTVSGVAPSRPSSTAVSVACPRPVAPSEPYSSTRIRQVASSSPVRSSRVAKWCAARIGPTVCELDGPMPILNRSNVLTATGDLGCDGVGCRGRIARGAPAAVSRCVHERRDLAHGARRVASREPRRAPPWRRPRRARSVRRRARPPRSPRPSRASRTRAWRATAGPRRAARARPPTRPTTGCR